MASPLEDENSELMAIIRQAVKEFYPDSERPMEKLSSQEKETLIKYLKAIGLDPKQKAKPKKVKQAKNHVKFALSIIKNNLLTIGPLESAAFTGATAAQQFAQEKFAERKALGFIKRHAKILKKRLPSGLPLHSLTKSSKITQQALKQYNKNLNANIKLSNHEFENLKNSVKLFKNNMHALENRKKLSFRALNDTELANVATLGVVYHTTGAVRPVILGRIVGNPHGMIDFNNAFGGPRDKDQNLIDAMHYGYKNFLIQQGLITQQQNAPPESRKTSFMRKLSPFKN